MSCSYMLGLDQRTLRPLTPGAEDSGDKEADAEACNENERLDSECVLGKIMKYRFVLVLCVLLVCSVEKLNLRFQVSFCVKMNIYAIEI